ncbi:MAG: Malate dehydrogenase (oxaloacetate-decarboxylating) [Firmicutes bacterium]|nr:Malate dehydrogenase (oxaloacetate-decarboxylating) [Bacillota bacterium]
MADVAKSADVLIGVSAPGVFTPEINVFDSRIAPAVAAAVAYAAIRTGVARINMDPEDVKTRAAARIGHGNNN